LRQAANLTGDQVAEALMCSSGKISHIETARYKINPRDVRDLLALYGVTDGRADELLTLAKRAQETGWWQNYKDVLRKHFAVSVGLEADASAVRTYEPLLIPGLLQTEDYARIAIRDGGPLSLTDDDLDRQVEARMTRQQRLVGDKPLHLWAVLDESALRRPVGGPDVMHAQLKRLIELIKRPNITIQVLPIAVGVHPGVAGSFFIIEFPEAADSDVVYVDAVAGELYLEKPDEVRMCKLVFDRLCAVALPPTESRKVVAAAAKEFD
jgi:transcriptional regulator with XRE-family HTH domain